MIFGMKVNPVRLATVASAVVPLLLAPSAADAITVTRDDNVASLTAALLGGADGITVTAASLSGLSGSFSAKSTGTFTNASGTYGIGAGVVLSTGDVKDYDDGPNSNPTTGSPSQYGGGLGTIATAAQNALLDSLSALHTGFDYYDVTQLDLTIDADAGVSKIFLKLVFGSEEYPEVLNADPYAYHDAFGVFLNGTNIALSGGEVISAVHSDMAAIAGTELDAILDPTASTGDPIVLFEGLISPGSTGNTLTIIIGDTIDGWGDSTVFVEALTTDFSETVAVPGPGAIAIFGLALLGLHRYRHRPKA